MNEISTICLDIKKSITCGSRRQQMAHSGLPQHPPRESVIGGTADMRLSASCNQPLLQFRPSPPSRDILYGDRNCLLLAHEDNQTLAPCNTGVEQIPLQHRVMLRHYGDDHGRVLRTLAFVDRGGIIRNQHVQFTEAIDDISAIKGRDKLAGIRIDIFDKADVTIVEFMASPFTMLSCAYARPGTLEVPADRLFSCTSRTPILPFPG